MAKESIEERKKNIQKLLQEKRLNEAFAHLREITEETSNWQISDKLEELEQSYKYMVRYVADGIDDPQRDEIHEGIITKAFELCDIAAGELVAQTSPKLYYSTLRTERMHPGNAAMLLQRHRNAEKKLAVFNELPDPEKDAAQTLALSREKEAAETAIFRHIWVAFPMPQDELEEIGKAFADSGIPTSLKEIMTAAIMMNLLEHYNEALLLRLLDTYADRTTGTRLQMVSLCCALIVMHRYRHLTAHSRQVSLRIGNLADSSRARNDIMTVFLQFIRSRGTERISKKVQDELVPRIMKLSPEIRRKMRGTNLTDDLEDPEKNPDWQDVLDKSGITAKMQELNQMQMEGSDVFLSSFSHLKNFPFFGEIANWFLPFDPNHSSVSPILANGKSPLLTIINSTGAFCDSDKYSFALSLASVPPQQRETMLGQFDEQNIQMMETASGLPDPEKERENIANKYVQNLYRFFNLFSRKSEFYNPFQTQLNLTEVPFVADFLSDAKSLRLTAEFYFKQEHYADALPVFGKLLKQESPSVNTYQKIGFCHESLKQYAEAAANYEKADLMKNDDAWTLKHLASCRRANGETDEAAVCYKRAEALQPDNVAIANNLGYCLLESGNPEEALKYFFKVDYMASKGARTLRPIAWCSLLTGNYNQSIGCYDKIIAQAPTGDDFVNRGHALLCEGRVKEAVESYRRPLSDKTFGSGKVIDAIESDRPMLVKAGISDTLIALVIDGIRYQSQPEE